MPLETTLEDRAILAWVRRRLLPREAASTLLAATEALTLAALAALGRLREAGGYAKLLAENRRLRIEVTQLRDESRLLRSRLEAIAPRRRPHYSPKARFQVLAHMRAFLLSVEQTARRFLVTPQTLYNWLAELTRHPDAQAIGSLLRPSPPLRRYADVARQLARRMKRSGFGGDRQIAMTLALSGWRPSRRSVGRFCKEQDALEPDPPPGPPMPTAVRGRHANHLWLADVTRVPLVFPFLHLHLGVVFDAFSRLPLQYAVSYSEPTAAAMLALVKAAIRLHGKPRHFVSDHGSQFTAEAFTRALGTLGIRQRFGALYQHGSIALVERFWKTLKTDLRLGERLFRPWNLHEFERRLAAALIRYSYCRPHSALGGRVPAEAFFGIAGSRPLANLAPRGRPADPDPECPFEILSLDPETTSLPILLPKAA